MHVLQLINKMDNKSSSGHFLLDKVNFLGSPFYGAYPIEWCEVPCQRPFGGRGNHWDSQTITFFK